MNLLEISPVNIEDIINTDSLDVTLWRTANLIWKHHALTAGFDWKNPNWAAPENYNISKDKPLREWKWEFIRRNPFYRTAWHVHENTDPHSKNPHEARRPEIREILLELFDLRNVPDPRHDAEHYKRLVERSWIDGPEEDTLFGEFDHDLKGVCFRHRSLNNVMVDIDDLLEKSEFDDSHVFYVRVDAKELLKGQLSAAFDQIMQYRNVERLQTEAERRRKATRNRTDKWGDYLRVLDAEEAGISHAVIATLLKNKRSGSDSAGESLEQALKIRRDFGREI